jgi:glutathione synthase/RimK-type ligase-like ATP-grasp enzyme
VHRDQAAFKAAEALNTNCHCVNVELPALRAAVEARLATDGLPADLAASHPHLFSRTPIFLSAAHARRMAGAVRAAEAAVALPAYREAALRWAPEIARHDSGARGAFLGFDFHLSADGPKLIEINTNAGGGFLAAMLGDAALACCGSAVTQEQVHPAFQQRAVDMLVEEWRHAGRAGRPRSIAIVDEAPESQYLHPEFLLAQSALQRAGIPAIVASPGELRLRGGVLYARGEPVDLVYNRLTDFALEAPEHRTLREAYVGANAVVTPNPRAHALYADKRLLGLLGDAAWLRGAGLDPALADLLGEVVPATATVRSEDGARLWQERKKLFFKPFAGFGSRGAYRGDKLTRRVFEEILRGGYVAQALVPPAERVLSQAGSALKFDVRNFAYGGEVQLLAARLWQGQTTNFRSEGGGFAPVLVLP